MHAIRGSIPRLLAEHQLALPPPLEPPLREALTFPLHRAQKWYLIAIPLDSCGGNRNGFPEGEGMVRLLQVLYNVDYFMPTAG